MAIYAAHNKALPVINDIAGFLMFNVDFKVWSLSRLNFAFTKAKK